LESPTVPLDDVFFPSVVVCNMNSLRKSFIHDLMSDPEISKLITFREMWNLIDDVYIVGGKEVLSPTEEQVISRKFIKINFNHATAIFNAHF
jgi:hypothetical protein